ncbi:hypothetical protein NZD89_09965 [Alicyclobacillus fastidiosus]|uniref:Uncharacterized protein n=1 Tax=Alicyclobacillus fastidiosus TaxID=392011 RepID=A0ABY6ZMF9_9BACL|nr:hypothetical protein [Alicyclobacillus fastidiosus]WAH43672.1 hypothetical protein NZD89_09965 [Alicyclobacillus fastidiosus]GMA59874.1 hypothetical protein GCM10025859_03140 [Alicyclobacillus fastidiosus]
MDQERSPSLKDFPKPIRDQVMKMLRTAVKRRKGRAEEEASHRPDPR